MSRSTGGSVNKIKSILLLGFIAVAAASARAEVPLIDRASQIKTGVIPPSKLTFAPIISTGTLQAGTTVYVSSGTFGVVCWTDGSCQTTSATSGTVSVNGSMIGNGLAGSPLGVKPSSVAVLVNGLVSTANLPLAATTATVNASMIGNGTPGSPLGVNPSSVAVLVNGLISASNLPPASSSSATFAHVSGFNSTLGTGSTFYEFIPSQNITLRRITALPVVISSGGAGDRWIASDGTTDFSVTTPSGTFTAASSNGSVNVSSGTPVFLRMESTALPTATAAVDLEFVAQ